jgi:hypothetical protein
MKYVDGSEVMLGDVVAMGDGAEGVVVCNFDANQYEAGFPLAEWAYLKQGVLVRFTKYGLVHYEQLDPDLGFVRRTANPI